MQPSTRLQQVLKIGDTLALFPLFETWSSKELQALLKDVEEFSDATYEAIDKAWEQIAFRPDAFLQKTASASIDQIRDEQKKRVMMVLSEICSVAIFYLGERGIEVEIEE